MYVIILLLILFLIFLFIFIIYEPFINYSYINYTNDIYSIRPPYVLASEYNPDKIGPFRILKYNFLNFPIEGFNSRYIN